MSWAIKRRRARLPLKKDLADFHDTLAAGVFCGRREIENQVRKMMKETSINGTFSHIPNVTKPSGLINGNDLLKWLKRQARKK